MLEIPSGNSANVAVSNFDDAMDSIANNAEARVRGVFNAVADGGSEKALNDNLTWAIAQKAQHWFYSAFERESSS